MNGWGEAMFKTICKTGVSAATLMACTAFGAQAQLLLPSGAAASNVVTFGDSLSDGGNFKAQNPGAAFNAPYLGGATFLNGAANPLPLNLNRFTNGLTWAEVLAAQTGAGAPRLFGSGALPAGSNVNYAFGASRSDNSNTTPALVGTQATLGAALGIQGVIASPTAVGATAPIGGGASFGITTVPGLPNQIGTYAAAGGTFGPNSLVTIWSGANDIFQISSGYPAGATANGIIQAAAGNVATAAGQAMALGARNVLVNNLPDLGATPSSISGGAAAIAQGSAASTGYNTVLSFAMATVANAAPAGTNIILVDVAKAFASITANPATYGLTNVTAACVTTPACVGGGAAAQAQYLFWDSVHPTAAGHALVAALAQNYLNAAGSLPGYGRLTATGTEMRLDAQRATLERLQALQARARLFGLGAIGVNEAQIIAEGSSGNPLGGKLTGGTVRILADRAITNEIRGGFALHYTQADIGAAGASGRITAYSGDMYLGWMSPTGAFVNAALGVGRDDYSLRRATTFFGASGRGSANATTISGSLEAGYAFKLSQTFTLAPFLRLETSHSSVSTLNEGANPGAQLQLRGRNVSATYGVAALRADIALGSGLVAHAVVGYAHALARSGNTVTGGFVNSPSVLAPVTYAMPKGAVVVGAGIEGQIGQNLSLGADYRGRIAVNGGGNSHAGRVTLTAKF